jgi:site-specific DNA recombinase
MSAKHSTNGATVKAAALYRNSDDKQENSVQRQRDGVVPYAHHKGYETVAEYVFDGIPGDEIGHHPDWKRLMRDAVAGRWAVLVMDEPSRLSRDDPDDFVADVKRPLKRAGVKVDSVNKGLLDWDTLAGDIMTLVHSHEAREEVRKMSRRVLGGIARLAKEGDYFGWRCPYGLRIVRDIDPQTGKVIGRRCVFGPEEEVRTIRFIFDAVANRGWSLRRICRELNARGVKAPQRTGHTGTGESKWNPTTIRRFLKNRKYIGDLPWNETHHGKYSRWLGGADGRIEQHDTANHRNSKNDTDDVVLVPDIIPPLIDRDLFVRAGKVQEASQKRTSPNGDNMRYLFTHMLTCGDCGAFMRGQPDRRRGLKAYICGTYKEQGTKACHRNAVYEEALLGAVLDKVLNVVLDPARLDEIEAEMKRQLEAEQSSGEADRLRQRLAKLERDIDQGNDKLLRLPEDRLPGVIAKLRAWEQERDTLAVRLEELVTGKSQHQEMLDEARRQLWRLREGLEGDDQEAQAAVIREVVSKIEMHFTHTKTHGRCSRKGKGGRESNNAIKAVLYVRPGLGLSCLSTPACRSPGREA